MWKILQPINQNQEAELILYGSFSLLRHSHLLLLVRWQQFSAQINYNSFCKSVVSFLSNVNSEWFIKMLKSVWYLSFLPFYKLMSGAAQQVCMLDLEHCHHNISAGVGRNVAKFLQTWGPLCLCLHSRVPSAQLPGTSLAKESSKDGAKSQRPPATREYTSIKSPAVSAHSSATRPRCLESPSPLATSISNKCKDEFTK